MFNKGFKFQIWPFRLEYKKEINMAGSANIEDLLRDAQNSGEIDFTTGGLPQGERAPSAIIVPPQRPDNVAQEASPVVEQGLAPQRTSFIVISSNEEGEVSVRFRDEVSVTALVEEIGVENVIRHIPNENPTLWAGKIIIIRGSVVIPKPVVSFKFEAF